MSKKRYRSFEPPLEDPKVWPGSDFAMDSPAGHALLGSPVRRWAGYFLMQHKRQLGGNRWIEKVRVFRSEKEGSLPYLLFYVSGSMEETKSGAVGSGVKVVREVNSQVGRNVVREHVFRAV